MKYRNPVLPGFHPDPSICRAGKDYYLAVSSFEYFPGVPVYHSRNLVNWEPEGYAFTRREQLDLTGCAPSAGIYAPTLRFYRGKFYLITTNVSAKGHILIHADHAEGPWSDPVTVEQNGIDPSLLFDGDRVYFCCNNLGAGGRQGIFLSEIDLQTGRTLTEPKCISFGTGGRYVEGPHLYHIGAYYYLMVSEGGTEYGHMVTVFRAGNPYGPYEACPHNPVLTHRDAGGNPVQATGHADLVEAADGKWWMVCLGIRPQKGCLLHHLGRETFLMPVMWDQDGWPHVNHDRLLTEEMDEELPLLPEMQSADFHETFSEKLCPEWRTLRVPLDQKYRRIRENRLHLSADGVKLSESTGTPSFLSVPQPCFSLQCFVEMEITKEDFSAGLTAFYGADYHYDIFLMKRNGETLVSFRKRLHDMECTVKETIVPSGCGTVRLMIDADEREYRFYAAAIDHHADEKTAGAARLLGTGLTAGLSTEGTHYMSFTGVMLGIFCEEGEGIFSDFHICEKRGKSE
jgi:xylan 1,4-beta-xylosidase